MGWWSRLRRGESTSETVPPPGEPADLPPTRSGRTAPQRLTTLNFDRFVRDHRRAVIDVWAPWCGPCRAFAPVFASAAEQWGTEVGFGKLHADHEPTLMRRFRVRSIPSLLFFRDGRMVRLEVGAVSSDRFDRQLHLVFRDLPA